MSRYLLSRFLLFFPTLIGATITIFMVMACSPTSIVDVLLPPGGDLMPGQRAVREAYVQERYGLDDPPYIQYVHWLNHISPIGFRTWSLNDPEVVTAKAQEKAARHTREAELIGAGKSVEDAEKLAKDIKVRPHAGDLQLNHPTFKSPDMGTSFIQSRPSWERIKEALPVTISLQLVSLPIALVISLLTGIRAARFRGQLQDRAIGTTLLAMYAIPVIWLGVMMIGFLANVEYVRAFPEGGLHSLRADEMNFLPRFAGGFSPGYLLDTVWHLVLPVVCIGYTTVAFYSKLTRTTLLEVLSSDYVRTARAKGLSNKVVLYRHAFRNSLVSLITVAASFLPRLVTGSIVVESIFNINGMGRLAIESLKGNDRELFLSVSVLILLLQLAGNLIADVLYVVADPRVSYDK